MANGCSFFSVKGTTVRPTIALMIVIFQSSWAFAKVIFYFSHSLSRPNPKVQPIAVLPELSPIGFVHDGNWFSLMNGFAGFRRETVLEVGVALNLKKYIKIQINRLAFQWIIPFEISLVLSALMKESRPLSFHRALPPGLLSLRAARGLRRCLSLVAGLAPPDGSGGWSCKTGWRAGPTDPRSHSGPCLNIFWGVTFCHYSILWLHSDT